MFSASYVLCLYEASPALYDKSHIEYSNRTVKKSLEEHIAQHLGKPHRRYSLDRPTFVVFIANEILGLQYGQCDIRRRCGYP